MQKGRTFHGALHVHPATIRRDVISAHKIKLAQSINRTANRRLADAEVLSKIGGRMRPIVLVADQENAQLPCA